VISVDTSVVVRYLVGTPVAGARRARAVLDQQGPVGIPIVVLLETAHVLRTQYGVERRDVLDTLVELVTREDVETIGVSKSLVIEGLVRARALPGSPLPDALVIAMVRDAGALPLYSFDRDMARHGIEVRTP
jgi:predicted nucleic acid-binding protein